MLGEGTPSSQPQSASLTAPSQGHTPSASLSGGGSAASTSSKSRSRSTTAADAAIVASLLKSPVHYKGTVSPTELFITVIAVCFLIIFGKIRYYDPDKSNNL